MPATCCSKPQLSRCVSIRSKRDTAFADIPEKEDAVLELRLPRRADDGAEQGEVAADELAVRGAAPENLYGLTSYPVARFSGAFWLASSRENSGW